MPPDRVASPPLDDLLLDQDEDDLGLGPTGGLSLFNSLGFPVLDATLGCSSTPDIGELLLDTDSGDEYNLVEADDLSLFQEFGVGEARLDPDQFEEDEHCTGTPVRLPVVFSGRNLPALLVSRHLSNGSLEVINPSPAQPKTGSYVDRMSHSAPQGPSHAKESCRKSELDGAVASHTAQQTRSDGIRTSQAKGDIDHMAHLQEWGSQIASNNSLAISARAPVSHDPGIPASSLDNEMPLDMDTDMEEGDIELRLHRVPGKSRSLVTDTKQEPIIDPDTNRSLCHEEFLDVLSEDRCSGEELDMGNLNDRDMDLILTCIDCIIDASMITGSIIQQDDVEGLDGEEVIPEVEFLELVDEEFGLESGCDRQDGARSLPDNRDELNDC